MIPGATGAGRARALEVALAAILCHVLALSSLGCRSNPEAEVTIPATEAELRAAIRHDRGLVVEWVASAPDAQSASAESEGRNDQEPDAFDPGLVEIGRRLSAYQRALDELATDDWQPSRSPGKTEFIR